MMSKREWLFTLVVALVLAGSLWWLSDQVTEDDPVPPPLPEPTVVYSSEPHGPDRVFE